MPQPDPSNPSTDLATRARQILAGAQLATLHTGPREFVAPASTIVRVDDSGDGTTLVWLEARAKAVLDLAARRVATLVIAGDHGALLQLAGSLVMRRPTESGMRAYDLSPLSIRLIDKRVDRSPMPVPVADFQRARIDPIACRAARILEHLEAAHGEDLLACVRAHGHRASAVVPRSLTSTGLELLLLGPEGVDTVHLQFRNGPVERVEDLDAGLRLPLSCACRRHAPSDAS